MILPGHFCFNHSRGFLIYVDHFLFYIKTPTGQYRVLYSIIQYTTSQYYMVAAVGSSNLVTREDCKL